MIEIVLGPPGTGKTTTLLGMVDEELGRGVPPDRVGYVSFTTRAAREAVERACEKFSLTERDLPHFRTLHSLCFRELGLSRGDVLEGSKLLEFGDWMRVKVSKFRSMEDSAMFGFETGDRILFMENLSRIRCVSLREQYDYDDDDLPWNEVERVARGLAEFKRARHLVDYTDMLTMFEQSEWCPELEVLLVDEAQDLSILQWRVVMKLAQRARRVVLAGDDDQAIYRWAGAAVEHFVQMPGDVRVLGQSYRVPPAVQSLSHSVISRVRNRRPKDWRPADKDGQVLRPSHLEDVDFSQESVLVLGRNAVALKEVKRLLDSDGVFYEFRGANSVRPKVLSAIWTWERLRAGEPQTVEDVQEMYELMSVGHGVARGHKRLPELQGRDRVSLEDLRTSGGLRADGIWHEALDRIPEEEREYITRCRRRGEKLQKRPRVRLSTIHGAKGGEADHVVLIPDMAHRTWVEADWWPEDEARVWYVAVTRARHQLSVLAPRTPKHYDV